MTAVAQPQRAMLPRRPRLTTAREVLHATPWPVLIFLFTLLIPTELGFYIGDLRLSWYRVLLLLMFVPAIVKLVGGGAGRMMLSDWLMIFHVVWAFGVIMALHTLETATKSQGIYAVEALGAYMIGRCYVRDERTFRASATVLVWLVLLLGLVTIPESITGKHWIHDVASAASGQRFVSDIEDRYGLSRAYGPFEHPILYGVFTGSVLGFAWYLAQTPRRGFMRCIGIAISSVASVSSGAVTALWLQAFLVGWQTVLRRVRARWWILLAALVAAYFLVDMASHRRPMEVALAYLTFNPDTAYGRMQIWDYGSAEVWRHPLTGIGYKDWERPIWFASGSMDNFWLVLAVTYGLPGVFSFMGSAADVFVRVAKMVRREGPSAAAGRGWLTSVGGLCIAACTVHLWNASFVYLCFLIGMGVCLGQLPAPPRVVARPKVQIA